MANPKGQKENTQEVQKVSEFWTAFALLRMQQCPVLCPVLVLDTDIAAGRLYLSYSGTNKGGWCWQLHQAGVELMGLQTWLLIAACSGNLILTELGATVGKLQVMQICLCIGHIRTV